MKISQDGVNSLVNLLKKILNGSEVTAVMRITNPQYSGLYLKIFLDEAERNNFQPIGYDDFKDELWIRLGLNADDYVEECNEFMRTWNAWKELYQYLNKENKLVME